MILSLAGRGEIAKREDIQSSLTIEREVVVGFGLFVKVLRRSESERALSCSLPWRFGAFRCPDWFIQNLPSQLFLIDSLSRIVKGDGFARPFRPRTDWHC